MIYMTIGQEGWENRHVEQNFLILVKLSMFWFRMDCSKLRCYGLFIDTLS